MPNRDARRPKILLFNLLLLPFFLLAGSAQTNFATLLSDGAWTWFNDPRAIFHNGILYFGYVRASDGRSALNTFSLQSGQTTNLWTSSRTETDDHDNCGLLAKPDGTLLAVYSRHQTDQFFSYRLSASTNPVSPADWGTERTNSPGMTVGSGMTYANPFQLANENGKLYNFGRYINYNPNVFTSTDGGTNWSTPQTLIQTGSGSTRPYVKYCSDYKSRIDVLYTDAHPDNFTTSLYHIYYQSNSVCKTDGTILKSFANLPLLHDSGERGSLIYQYSDAASSDFNQWIATGRAWCWEIGYQTNGNPACVFQVKVDNVTGSAWADARIYYYYARWTGTGWQKKFIAQAGRPLYNGQPDYGGGIALDPQDVNTIYLSSDAVNPFDVSTVTSVPLGSHYEIWKGVTTDGGLTFSWQAVTTNSTVDNLRPYVPRRFGGEPSVLWFRGTYASYTSFSTAIVGLFTTQVPTNAVPPTSPASPKITYVDASSGVSGNTALAAGGTFAPPANTATTTNWNERSPFASGGNIFESSGATASIGENAPRLVTTITNLAPGAAYSVYAYFWSKTAGSTTEQWLLRAGLTNSAGELTSFGTSGSNLMGITSTAASPVASTTNFAVAPTIISENGRLMYSASLGKATADAGGKIAVFIDDYSPVTTVNNRTWYDGVGYAAAPSLNATNMNCALSGSNLALTWPVSHLGWVLQSQTNGLNTGLATNWVDVTGSDASTQRVISVDPAPRGAFFRLRSP